jgi:hypothetical protein
MQLLSPVIFARTAYRAGQLEAVECSKHEEINAVGFRIWTVDGGQGTQEEVG